MTVYCVLIERDQHVDLVAQIADRLIAGADGQECMPTSDDRLIGVVSVEMKPAPRKDAGQDVSRGGDALTVLAADGDCEIYSVHCAFPASLGAQRGQTTTPHR